MQFPQDVEPSFVFDWKQPQYKSYSVRCDKKGLIDLTAKKLHLLCV